MRRTGTHQAVNMCLHDKGLQGECQKRDERNRQPQTIILRPAAADPQYGGP
jgi:hypothetical protein